MYVCVYVCMYVCMYIHFMYLYAYQLCHIAIPNRIVLSRHFHAINCLKNSLNTIHIHVYINTPLKRILWIYDLTLQLVSMTVVPKLGWFNVCNNCVRS